MIQIHELTASIGRREILHGIDLTIPDGAVTVLLGKNGSGKTTLMRCIAGLLSYSGTIALGGVDRRKLSRKEAARLLSLQTQSLSATAISVERLVQYGRAPHMGYSGVLTDADRSVCEQVLRDTALTEFRHRMVCHLSGGERQLAFFAMTLAQGAPNLLLDEPTASLDPLYRGTVYDALRRRRDENKSVLLSMHDLNDAIAIADNIAVMDKGRLIFFGTAEEFLQSPCPRDIFGKTPVPVTADDGTRFIVLTDQHSAGPAGSAC